MSEKPLQKLAPLFLNIGGIDMLYQISRMLGEHKKPHKYRTQIEYDQISTKVHNAQVIVDRYKNKQPKTKRQIKELKLAQSILASYPGDEPEITTSHPLTLPEE